MESSQTDSNEWQIGNYDFLLVIDWYLKTLQKSNVPYENIELNRAVLMTFYHSIDAHLDGLRKNGFI